MTGMLSALEVLPDPALGRGRPVSNAASSALLNAWLHNRELADLLDHTAGVLSAAFGPDGKHVVTASGTTRRGSGTSQGHGRSQPCSKAIPTPYWMRRSAPTANASSPRPMTTRRGSGTSQGHGPVATVLEGHTDTVWSAAFSPDGKRVVTASGTRRHGSGICPGHGPIICNRARRSYR